MMTMAATSGPLMADPDARRHRVGACGWPGPLDSSGL